MKKTCGALFAVALAMLVAACGSGFAPDAGENERGNRSGNSLPERFIMLEAGEWPQNEYTETIPQPVAGTVSEGWIDPDKAYCYLKLSDITQASSEQYIKSLKKAGFSEVKRNAEKLDDDTVSVGALFQNGDTSVSLSYLDDILGICINCGKTDD